MFASTGVGMFLEGLAEKASKSSQVPTPGLITLGTVGIALGIAILRTTRPLFPESLTQCLAFSAFGIPMCVVGILLFVGGVRGTVTPHGIAVLSGFGASGLGLAMLGASVSWVLQKWGLSWWRRITSSNSVEPYAGERQAPRAMALL